MRYRKKRIVFELSILAICFMGLYYVCVNAVATGMLADMPVLYLTLDTDPALTEKEYSDATLSVDYSGLVVAEDISMQLRYRGNTTYGYDKKPFKIKLDTAADLLVGNFSETGQNAATDWILLADWRDSGYFRNYFALWTASQLDGIEFVVEFTFVEVYFEGEYQGVYLMCEEVEIDTARLNLDENATGANAVLMEAIVTADAENSFQVTYGDEGEFDYNIRSNVSSDAQIERAQAAVQAANDAIVSGDQAAIAAVIDLDSCIDMYLVQEFTMNADVGYGSFYIYIKENDDTIYFGSPWDFDRCMGNETRSEDYTLFYASASDRNTSTNEWYRDLMQLDWFEQMVADRWNEKKDVFLAGLDEITALEEAYQETLLGDYAIWYQEEGQSADDLFAAYEAEQTQLREWIQNRYDWFDDYFNNLE